MRAKKAERDVARRDLLKLAGLGGVAGAAALATKGRTAEASSSARDGSGYRETKHVRRYYELAKF